MPARFCLRRLGSQPTVASVKDLLELTSDITIIGRNKHVADLFLDSTKTKGLISRIHARIIKTCKEGTENYEICDTSLNGTYVNDYKVASSVQLSHGDLITFGHIKGVIVDPGAFAPQKNSEFLYRFERINTGTKNDKPTQCHTSVQHSETTFSNDKIHNHGNSRLEHTPGAYDKFSFENKSAVANPADTLDFGYQTSDVDLRAIVESISAETGHESDEEFSLSSTLVQPSSVSRREALEGDVASPDTKSSKIRRASDEYQGHFSGTKRRKQDVHKQNKPRHRSDDGIIYAHDRCASIDCYHPRNATNTWVQCDDCDKWFHLKCAGLSDKAARSSETTFYCGCS